MASILLLYEPLLEVETEKNHFFHPVQIIKLKVTDNASPKGKFHYSKGLFYGIWVMTILNLSERYGNKV